MTEYVTGRLRKFPVDNDWVTGVLVRWGSTFSRVPNPLPEKIILPEDDELGCPDQIKILKSINDTLQSMTDAQVEFLATIAVAMESVALSHQAILELLRERVPTKKANKETHNREIEAKQRSAELISARLALLDFHLTNKEPVEMEFDMIEPWDGEDDTETSDDPLFSTKQQPPALGSGGGGGGN